ncbi:MAG: YihY/virulence factor BrkB family protein [Lachnospiraceae bacterium]|nr:YihY/virulence factor BrkB family protein [Lachnospiraceae bacterium]
MKKITKADILPLVQEFIRRFNQKNMAAFAGSATFFFVMALIPTLIVLSSLLPYTSVTEENLIYAVTTVTPWFVDQFATQMIDEAYNQATAILPISVIVMIWSGAVGMLALIRGLNAMNDVQEQRNYFVLRAIAGVYTLIMQILIIFMLISLAFGSVLRNSLAHNITHPQIFFALTLPFRYVLGLCVSILLFAVIYAFLPGKRQPFRRQLPGAIFAGCAWSIFSVLLSIYAGTLDGYSLYGSLAVPVIIMFWLYTCIYIFLLGAFLNKFLWDVVFPYLK